MDDDPDVRIEWRESRMVDCVVERPFRVHRANGPVPGILWLPPWSSGPRPLVLLGHGGSGHKRSDRLVMSARWFVTQAGVAAMAIDGPFHGERVTTSLSASQYQARIAKAGLGAVLDRMAQDWRAAVRIVAASGLADANQLALFLRTGSGPTVPTCFGSTPPSGKTIWPHPWPAYSSLRCGFRLELVEPEQVAPVGPKQVRGIIAYLGMSMGTRFGLPVVAGMANRFRCVVFGKFGLQQCTSMHPAMAAPERIMSDARQITAPTLFHIQLHDEVFHRDGQLALFDLLASEDKRLIGHPGLHGTTPAAAIDDWRNFIVAHLTSKS